MIFLTYAFPSRLQLRRTRKAFRCEIASSHGSTETGFVFTACEKGRFHQNLDSCRVDFLPFQARYGGPHRGKIFVTTFGNPWFPVLRFDIGDLVRLDDRGPCPCGRNRGLTLAAIEGRAQDSTLRPDGGLVTLDELDAALARVEGLRAYRLDQLDAEAYRLKAIPEPTHAELTVLSSAKKALQRLYGPAARIEVESVTALTPEPSGKFRLARALFPIDTDVFLESRPLRDVV